MIRLRQPSMSLNDFRATGTYRMWNTWNVKKDVTREGVIGWVATVARDTKKGRLKNLVINCHGNSGAIHLGKDWWSRKHTYLFSGWRKLVRKIWFLSCEVALIEGSGKNDGNLFCSEIAKQAQCYVIASTAVQKNLPRTYPYGKIDTFEGTVLKYGPEGNVVWSKTYGSWITNLE